MTRRRGFQNGLCNDEAAFIVGSGSRFVESVTARFKTNKIAAIVSSGVAVLLGLYLNFYRPGEPFEWVSFDIPHLFMPDTAITNLQIVLMDDQSHRGLNQQPGQIWDRALHARLLNKLKDDGASLVVFDVFFDEGSLTNQAPADLELAESMRQFGKVVLAGAFAKSNHPNAVGGQTLPPAKVFLDVIGDWWGVPSIRRDGDYRVRGHFNEPRRDPSLPWAAARLAGAPVTRTAEARFQHRWLHYYRHSPLPGLAYMHALKAAPDEFRGKVVFIGSDFAMKAQGSMADVFPTPTRPEMPGVEIAATAFLNLLRNDWIEKMDPGLELAILLLGGAVIGVVLGLIRPLPGLAVSAVAVIAVMAASSATFWGARVWYNWAILAFAQIPVAWVCAALFYGRRLAREVEETVTRGYGEPLASTEPVSTAKLHIPDFTLLKCIGEGAYGEVWLAESFTGTYRAIKVVYRLRFRTERPFEREFEGLLHFTPISLSHPGWVGILHAGQGPRDEYFYYVMEAADDLRLGEDIDPDTYVPKTLSKLIEDRTRLPVSDCLAIAIPLADALAALHAHQLTHRDIKPSNIIFVAGHPKLADIGLVTAAGEVSSRGMGTEGFIPPEGTGLPPADLFALGKVLYQTVTGYKADMYPRLPADLDARDPSGPLQRLLDLVRIACAEKAVDRFPSAGAMAAALRELQKSS